MKDDVLHSVKSQMAEMIHQLDLDNLEQQQQMLESYFDFLKTLRGLPTVIVPSHTEPAEALINLSDAESATTAETVEAEKLPQDEDLLPREAPTQYPAVNLHVFERKLRGGFFPTLDGGQMIPEKMVRDIGLEHGDTVAVVDSFKSEYQNRYKFEIVEKADNGDAPGRIEVGHCIVDPSVSGASFHVGKTINGDIFVDGEPYKFVLSAKDAQTFNIRSGDIVDIAYYDNSLESVKLIFKHELGSSEAPAPSAAKKPQNKRSDDGDETNMERSFPFSTEFMKNKNVVIVGSEFEKANYQRAFEMLKINLSHMSGDEGKTRIRAAIKKADAVIVTRDHVSHRGSAAAAELSKEFNVPFACVDRHGPQHILLEAEKVMKRKLDQATA